MGTELIYNPNTGMIAVVNNDTATNKNGFNALVNYNNLETYLEQIIAKKGTPIKISDITEANLINTPLFKDPKTKNTNDKQAIIDMLEKLFESKIGAAGTLKAGDLAAMGVGANPKDKLKDRMTKFLQSNIHDSPGNVATRTTATNIQRGYYRDTTAAADKDEFVAIKYKTTSGTKVIIEGEKALGKADVSGDAANELTLLKGISGLTSLSAVNFGYDDAQAYTGNKAPTAGAKGINIPSLTAPSTGATGASSKAGSSKKTSNPAGSTLKPVKHQSKVYKAALKLAHQERAKVIAKAAKITTVEDLVNHQEKLEKEYKALVTEFTSLKFKDGTNTYTLAQIQTKIKDPATDDQERTRLAELLHSKFKDLSSRIKALEIGKKGMSIKTNRLQRMLLDTIKDTEKKLETVVNLSKNIKPANKAINITAIDNAFNQFIATKYRFGRTGSFGTKRTYNLSTLMKKLSNHSQAVDNSLKVEISGHKNTTLPKLNKELAKLRVMAEIAESEFVDKQKGSTLRSIHSANPYDTKVIATFNNSNTKGKQRALDPKDFENAVKADGTANKAVIDGIKNKYGMDLVKTAKDLTKDFPNTDPIMFAAEIARYFEAMIKGDNGARAAAEEKMQELKVKSQNLKDLGFTKSGAGSLSRTLTNISEFIRGDIWDVHNREDLFLKHLEQTGDNRLLALGYSFLRGGLGFSVFSGVNLTGDLMRYGNALYSALEKIDGDALPPSLEPLVTKRTVESGQIFDSSNALLPFTKGIVLKEKSGNFEVQSIPTDLKDLLTVFGKSTDKDQKAFIKGFYKIGPSKSGASTTKTTVTGLDEPAMAQSLFNMIESAHKNYTRANPSNASKALYDKLLAYQKDPNHTKKVFKDIATNRIPLAKSELGLVGIAFAKSLSAFLKKTKKPGFAAKGERSVDRRVTARLNIIRKRYNRMRESFFGKNQNGIYDQVRAMYPRVSTLTAYRY